MGVLPRTDQRMRHQLVAALELQLVLRHKLVGLLNDVIELGVVALKLAVTHGRSIGANQGEETVIAACHRHAQSIR